MSKLIIEKNTWIIGILCMIFTIFDGVLTYIGLNYGHEESNMIINFVASYLGYSITLILYVVIMIYAILLIIVITVANKIKMLSRVAFFVLSIRLVLLIYVTMVWVLIIWFV